MKWRDRFLELARTIGSWSRDTTKVGAVAVGSSREILEVGYNGIPRGVADRAERLERPEKYAWTVHAEQNLIATAARARLEGSTVFVTHLCCSHCAAMLINAGVSKVVAGDGKTSMDPRAFEIARTMFAEAGVELEVVE